MYKIGISTTCAPVTEELFASCRDSGIDCVELSRDRKESDAYDYEKIKEWSEKYGVKVWSLHLPFWPFGEIDISLPSIADKTVEYLCTFIEKGTKIGIDKFIIHASGEPIEDSCRKERMECAKKSLCRLAEYAAQRGATICVEDLPRTCLGREISDIKELISAHGALRVCFDTNHLLYEDNARFVRELGDKIVTLHVSDYDKVNERHWLPGEGVIDWQALLCSLKDVGYSGVWMYEIGYNCPKTIIRNRNLTNDDFVRNAHELFENKKITIFSEPKKDLGYWE